MAPFVIELETPMKPASGPGEIAKIVVKEPTAGQVMTCEKKLSGASNSLTYRAYQIALVHVCTGLSEDDVRALPIGIFQRAMRWLDAATANSANEQDQGAQELQIDLEPPLVSAGITFAQVALTEPTVGQILKAEMKLNGGGSPADIRNYLIGLVCEVAEMPYAAACELPVSVVNRGAGFVRRFLEDGREAGAA